jgi:GNAT superfamily N-acetyltransferase
MFCREPAHIYLRHFFIHRDFRRQGLGRAAYEWLSMHAWAGNPRIRLDVLIHNEVGQSFWRSLGFNGYCLTMEKERT